MPESVLRKLARGVELLAEESGTGRSAQKGDHVIYNTRFFLRRGEEVPVNESRAGHIPDEYKRTVDGFVYIDHRIRLGYRECIAGLETGLFGMQVGGYRRLRIAPHLAYREKGIEGLIPPNALLEVDVYVREIEPAVVRH